MTTIPGYTYDSDLAISPVSTDDLERLLATLLWTEADAAALAVAGEVLADQIDDVLDVWYGYVGSHAHLVRSFNGEDGQPSGDYLAAVRARFGQWIRDLTGRPWDARWLAYQHEIALRHTSAMGRTDGITSDETHVPLRSLIAFVFPITATVRPFLAAKGHAPDDVDAMHTAWFKAVTLTAALWAEPYAPRYW